MGKNEISRLEISDWDLVRVEQRGKHEKTWLRYPDAPSSDPLWLFKPVKTHAQGGRQVNDWTELVASHVARDLGVEAATIRLVTRFGQEGCISRDVRPDATWSMHSGRLWMDADSRVDFSSVAAGRSARQHGASPGHSLENVFTSLDGVEAPPSYDGLRLRAWDVFVAYLVIDALIGNRDRHEENWSVLVPLKGVEAIAPSYDMEVGLGFQLLDPKREWILADESGARLRLFAENATAWRFAGRQKDTLVGVARSAAELSEDRGREWIRLILARMQNLDSAQLFTPVVGMSVAARTFAIKLFETNVGRIRDAFIDF